MTKPTSQLAFVIIVGALALAITTLLSGCALTVPLGDEGRYGSLRGTVQYLPPVNLWEPATFLNDK